jgi:hypothetical protein
MRLESTETQQREVQGDSFSPQFKILFFYIMEAEQDLDKNPPLNDSILKPKPTRKAPNFTPEHRAALAERMKKVNADRIAKSKSAENAKIREQKALEKEQKRLELEAEIEKLKMEASQAPKMVAPLPKKERKSKPREDDHEPNYDQLIAKARERREVVVHTVPSDEESEPEPAPVKQRKPKTPKAEKLEPPRPVCKFL